MIQFDFSRAGVSIGELSKLAPQILPAHRKLLEERRRKIVGFWNLPKAAEELAKIQTTAGLVRKRFENLVVIGIGGSSLGLKCLLNALTPATYNLKKKPKIFLLENPDSGTVQDLLDFLDLSKTCFNVISKSGSTAETLALWETVQKPLSKKVGKKWLQHLVVTTGSQSGPLRTLAQKKPLAVFEVPANVGGRFSVLSSVGLFPAACVGIDVRSLLRGASMAVQQAAEPTLVQNPVYYNGALHYYLATQADKKISVMMPYRDGLKSFAEWYGQLWAESLGKTDKAQTPVAALGANDQHSQLQLYRGGPKDKVVTFVKVAGNSRNSLDRLLNAECDATAQALAEVACPSVMLTLPKWNAEVLGELLMHYQIQTAFAGHLFGINPYDQPDVERIKEITREILKSQ